MPKRLPLTHEAKARVSEITSLKIELYANKHDCSESAVVRKALKKFLLNVSTKSYKKQR